MRFVLTWNHLILVGAHANSESCPDIIIHGSLNSEIDTLVIGKVLSVASHQEEAAYATVDSQYFYFGTSYFVREEKAPH